VGMGMGMKFITVSFSSLRACVHANGGLSAHTVQWSIVNLVIGL